MFKLKKIRIIFILAVINALVILSTVGCGNNKQEPNSNQEILVLKTEDNLKIDSGYLLVDYMNDLKEDDKIEFEVENGFVTSINGIKNDAIKNKYWILYTDDETYGNSAWGVYDYEDRQLSSSSIGVSQPLKQGATYIWVFQAFN